jgi:plastocyanin
MFRYLAFMGTCALAASCGGSEGTPANPAVDGAVALDAPVDARTITDTGALDRVKVVDVSHAHDAGEEPDAPSRGDVVTATHECSDDRFVDRREGADATREIRALPEALYDPPCMIVRAGQSVNFTGNLRSHPLAPGVAPGMSGMGTTPTPILERSEGTSYVVQFTAPGDYPFYCVYHAGGGMYGVVRVTP